jgi:predicted CXXCH cytochrome family protein
MSRVLAAIVVAGLPLFAASPTHSVTGTQHDLTGTGTGPVKSTVTDSCLFCHAPHNVIPNITPLWDQTLSSQTYTTYTSSTYNSGAQTPATGSSKLCLSCHDGTVAVGLTVAKGQLPTTGTMNPADVFGSNLAKSHPVSMTAVDDGQLAATLFATPASTKDAAVKLDAGKTECITCHDPHVQNNDPTVPMFLVRTNSSGALCLACHDPSRVQPNQLNGWTSGAHATSADTVPTTGTFGAYGNVAANACSNCHGAHNNSAAPRALKASEEAACSP